MTKLENELVKMLTLTRNRFFACVLRNATGGDEELALAAVAKEDELLNRVRTHERGSELEAAVEAVGRVAEEVNEALRRAETSVRHETNEPHQRNSRL